MHSLMSASGKTPKHPQPTSKAVPWTGYFAQTIIARGGAAIMDLEVWLRKLGLAQYEAIFRDNAIDASVLHDLTEDHLREMGLPLGARLKLLKAISALAPSAEPIGLTPVVAPAGPPADTAERRQVTVMFADLVGSTALS